MKYNYIVKVYEDYNLVQQDRVVITGEHPKMFTTINGVCHRGEFIRSTDRHFVFVAI